MIEVIVALGTVALDTTSTPMKTVHEVLGGSAVYFAIASSFFHPTGILGVVGSDFSKDFQRLLDERIDLQGLQVQNGKTFRYVSKFGPDLNQRTTLRTDLNVLEYFEPILPEQYQTASYVYLGNIDPDQQLQVIDQTLNPELLVADTINLWIETKRETLIKVISETQGLCINDEEIRLLCQSFNLIKCSHVVLNWGTDFVIVKKGEHGALLATHASIFPSPAYPLAEVVDPTGAGDCFAGGFLGHIARKGVIDEPTLKEAVVYGHIMGSFVVEDFSVNRLLTLTLNDIEDRFHEYKEITTL